MRPLHGSESTQASEASASVEGFLPSLDLVLSSLRSSPSSAGHAPKPGSASVDLGRSSLRFLNSFNDATYFGIPFAGLCGGMAYTTLDYFMAGRPAPSRTTTPTMQEEIGQYVRERQWDSLVGRHGVRFFALLANADDASVGRSTEEAFGELRKHLDAGQPMPIGLVPWPWTANLARATEAHQVVARGYVVSESGALKVDVWDPNRPDEAHTWITHTGEGAGPNVWIEDGGARWRGFFVEDGYRAKVPPETGEKTFAKAPGGEAAGPSKQTTSELRAELPALKAIDEGLRKTTPIASRIERMNERLHPPAETDAPLGYARIPRRSLRLRGAFLASEASEVGDTASGGGEVSGLGSSDMFGDITKAIAAAGHSDALKEMSPVAGALATALDSGMGMALGLGKSLSSAGSGLAEEAISSLSSAVGEDVADIVGNVAEAVPLVGAIIKVGLDLAQAFDTVPAQIESSGQECQQLFKNLPPQKSGSLLGGGDSVPADFFVCVNPLAQFWLGPAGDPAKVARVQKKIEENATNFFGNNASKAFGVAFCGSSFSDMVRSYVTSPDVDPTMPPTLPFYVSGPLKCRSAIGMALMQITEGMIYDLNDFDWGKVASNSKGFFEIKGAGHARDLWAKSIERDARVLVETWRKRNPKDAKVGLPKAWRDRFKAIRKGLEASYVGNTKKQTDGGSALWTTYVDLFSKAYDKGYLNDDFVAFIFSRQQGSWPFGTIMRSGSSGFGCGNFTLGNYWLLNSRLLGTESDADYIRDGSSAAPPTWIWFTDPCPRSTAYQVRQLAKSWSNTTRPNYALGKEKLSDLLKQTKAAAEKKGQAKHEARSSAKELDKQGVSETPSTHPATQHLIAKVKEHAEAGARLPQKPTAAPVAHPTVSVPKRLKAAAKSSSASSSLSTAVSAMSTAAKTAETAMNAASQVADTASQVADTASDLFSSL